MKDVLKDYLWVEKFRPKTIDDTILPVATKQQLKKFVENNDIPNLLLSGPAGTGKTTAAKAVIRELGYDYMMINGSDSSESGIDSLRTNIRTFASSVSLDGQKKVVIIDEADHLSTVVQPALRNFIEAFSNNARFIFTCNYRNRIIDPLQSRLSLIDFFIPKAERPVLFKEFHERVMNILEKEGVTYDKKAVAQFIVKYFPDFRRVLNELQKFSASGHIDGSILSAVKEDAVVQLYNMFRTKNFTEVRKWIADNVDLGPADIFRKLFETMDHHVTKQSIPAFVVILADYQDKSTRVPDQELNMAAAFTEIMSEVDFLSAF